MKPFVCRHRLDDFYEAVLEQGVQDHMQRFPGLLLLLHGMP